MVSDRAFFAAALLIVVWMLVWFVWLRDLLPWGSWRQVLVTAAVDLAAFVTMGLVFGDYGVLLAGLLGAPLLIALSRVRSRLAGRR